MIFHIIVEAMIMILVQTTMIFPKIVETLMIFQITV